MTFFSKIVKTLVSVVMDHALSEVILAILTTTRLNLSYCMESDTFHTEVVCPCGNNAEGRKKINKK